MQIHDIDEDKEYECCCSCNHNIRKGKPVECYCAIDNHYIGYVDCFESVCERWEDADSN